MADESLTYNLFGRDVSASKALRGVGDSAKQAGEQVSSHMSRMGQVATGAAIGIGAAMGNIAAEGLLKLGGALVQGVKDAQAYQTLQQQTAAVLASTGNAAGTSVTHIDELAASLESMSGVDETLIIHGQNVLATFTGIKNSVGAGNDIFDQATAASLNLSSALGQDMQSSAIQVGKALNDPIKGISALQRVGVSFTAAQKDQIKALVAAGDTMGAQKVILGELNKEFGGAAKAAGEGLGGSVARLQDAFGDLMRSVGGALIPLLTQLASWTANLINSFSDSGSTAHQLGDIVRGVVVGAFNALMGVARSVAATLSEHKDVVAAVQGAFRILGSLMVNIVFPALKAVGTLLLSVLGPAFSAVMAIVSNVVIPVFRFLLRTAVAVFGGILDAATWAFGWVPGVGDKLKSAQGAFHTFAADVEATLNSIPDPTVTVTIRTAGDTQWLQRQGLFQNNAKLQMMERRAAGGPVRAGQPYTVGERGMEIFVPRQNGYIVPNDKVLGAVRDGSHVLSGGSTGVVVNLNAGTIIGNSREFAAAMDDAVRRAQGRGVLVGS